MFVVFFFLNFMFICQARMHMFIEYCFTTYAFFLSMDICARTHQCSHIYMHHGSWMRRAIAALLLALLQGLVADGMAEWRDRLQEGWMEGEDRG